MELRAYIHQTCPYSRSLLNVIHEVGMDEVVEIIDVRDMPFDGYRNGILSVPALSADGRMVLTGPFDSEWLRSFLSLYTTEIPSKDDLFRGYIQALFDNSATALFPWLTGDYSQLFDYPEYLIHAGGFGTIALRSHETLLRKIRDAVEDGMSSFIDEKEELFLKVISMNFLRELHWYHGAVLSREEFISTYTLPVFYHWVMNRASLGRSAILYDYDRKSMMEKVEKLRDYCILEYDELKVKAVKGA